MDRHETPILTPEPLARSNGYSNGTSNSSLNGTGSYGYSSHNNNNFESSTGPAGDKDIFQLSAAEARERLRMKKCRDPRADMWLEEKCRIVSSM